jgi:hypothetical protein
MLPFFAVTTCQISASSHVSRTLSRSSHPDSRQMTTGTALLADGTCPASPMSSLMLAVWRAYHATVRRASPNVISGKWSTDRQPPGGKRPRPTRRLFSADPRRHAYLHRTVVKRAQPTRRHHAIATATRRILRRMRGVPGIRRPGTATLGLHAARSSGLPVRGRRAPLLPGLVRDAGRQGDRHQRRGGRELPGRGMSSLPRLPEPD